MKTSVIEVHDMLSVLSVDEVEKRIGEVPGVESVTVNYAAGSATVRYDETRLEIADIKSAVRQSGYESAAPAAASAGDGHEGHTAPGAPPATPAPAAPKTPPVAPATAGAASAGAAQQDKAVPDAAPSTTPKPSPAAPDAAPAPTSVRRNQPRTPLPPPASRSCRRRTTRQSGAGQKLGRHSSCAVAITRLVLPRKQMHLATDLATSNGSITSKQENIMTIANVSQGSASWFATSVENCSGGNPSSRSPGDASQTI